jgi:hypothetical protein
MKEIDGGQAGENADETGDQSEGANPDYARRQLCAP